MKQPLVHLTLGSVGLSFEWCTERPQVRWGVSAIGIGLILFAYGLVGH